MQTFDFLTEVEKSLKQQAEVDIERWLNSAKDLQIEMASRLLFFARHFDSIPKELGDKYVEALLTTLESMPIDLKLPASMALREKLMALTDSLDKDSKQKLKFELQRHLQAC
jgi:hypothetical protein